MHRIVLALALIACTAAHAQGVTDLMKTPECASARVQLEEVLAAGGPRQRLAAVRRLAALSCLGETIPEEIAEPPRLKTEPSAASAPPRNRASPPPAVALEPIRLRPARALSFPGVAAPAVPPSAPVNPQPSVVTSCDAAGCWDSNGTRYHQQGPVLVGPRGACTVQAGVLNCP